MKISIIGTNGMLSVALTKYFYSNKNAQVDVYGLDAPKGYECSSFYAIDLLKDTLPFENLIESDIIFYASGAGVQAALQTDPTLIYNLNVSAPIEISIQLKKRGYRGIWVSFGSYMEIGVNKEEEKSFTEEEIVCSFLPVTNDYALSKRLYTRYMNDFKADFTFYHFILPNMFSEDDLKPGTRLVPYTLQYLQDYIADKNSQTPRFSSGFQTRQFITLEEMIQTVDRTIDKKVPSSIYNIGGGEFLSIRNLIERLFDIYKVPCKPEYFGNEIRRDNDIKSLCINGNKLKSLIFSLPEAKIEEIFKPKM